MDVAGEEVVNDEYGYEFDLENPFTSPADEPIASLLDAEGHHSPSVSAASSAARREAAAFISEVRYDGELNVQPRVAYLALNYVDRFLSKRQLAGDGHNPWAPRLLAISCLSLAAKMQRAAAISVADIQRGDPMFGEATIRRMERMVLDALEWRARSVTPLAFLGFFLSSCFPQPRHQPLVDAIKSRAVDLLLRVQPGEVARVRRGDGGGVRRRARLDGGRGGGQRRHAGDGARPPPERQFRERAHHHRRISGQQHRCEEALHGPTSAVGVGGVKREIG